MTNYRVELDGGQQGDTTIEAHDINRAWEKARAWAQEGSWPDGGCRVALRVYSSRKELTGHITIQPNHEALIKAAGGDPHCDHDWTSEGLGGCRENPGVWSLGGTAFKISSRCRRCGLRRDEHICGAQRNPDEHDTVSYFLPGEDDE